MIHVEGRNAASKGPVVLVHGAGVRANIFRSPVAETVVDALLEDGFDVWLENWRASIDLAPSEWTLDDAAVNDHPQAIKTIQEHTGFREVKAIVHCQGSTSFIMSACAGLIPDVRTIVANAVSLYTIVPAFSRFKLNVAVPILRQMFPYLDAQWGLHPPDFKSRVLRGVVELFHHECHNPVCKFTSFINGTGFPVLWRHENLNDQTHEWLKQEFAKVPLTFFSQMAQCVQRGNLVSLGKYKQLPEDYCARAPETDARFALIAGERNICFLPRGQQQTFEFLERHAKGRNFLHIFPGYGHLDVFMGKKAYIDIFPTILAELNRT